ncbi:MAG: hypothetical protein ACI9IJ_000956 [Psychromonas sp.]|jgi:hypothetical protein
MDMDITIEDESALKNILLADGGLVAESIFEKNKVWLFKMPII